MKEMTSTQPNSEVNIKVENVKEEVKDEFAGPATIVETSSPALEALGQALGQKPSVIQIQKNTIPGPPIVLPDCLNPDGSLKPGQTATPDASYWAQFMAQYDNDLNSLKQMIPLDMIKEEDIAAANNDDDPNGNHPGIPNGGQPANINKEFVTTFFDTLQHVSPHLPKKFKDVVFCENCKESRVKIATLEGKNIHLETKMVEMNNLCNALRTECNEKVQVALKEVNNAFQFESSLQVERRERLGEISQLKAVIDSLQKDNIGLRAQLNEMSNNNMGGKHDSERSKTETDSEVYQKMYEKISKNVNQKLHEVWQKKSAEISELKLVNERLTKENMLYNQGKVPSEGALVERKTLEEKVNNGLKVKLANKLHLMAMKEKCNMQTDRFRLLKQAVMKQHLEINTLKEVMAKQETECKKLEGTNTEMTSQVEKLKKANETIVQQHKKALALLKQKNETILELQTNKHEETMKKGQDLESIFDEIDNQLKTLNKNKSKAKVSPSKSKVSPSKTKVSPNKSKVSPNKTKVSPNNSKSKENEKSTKKSPTDEELALELLKDKKIKIEKEDADDKQESDEENEEAKCRYCSKTFTGDDCYIKQLNHEKSEHPSSTSSKTSGSTTSKSKSSSSTSTSKATALSTSSSKGSSSSSSSSSSKGSSSSSISSSKTAASTSTGKESTSSTTPPIKAEVEKTVKSSINKKIGKQIQVEVVKK